MHESNNLEALSSGEKNHDSEKQNFKTNKYLSIECSSKPLHGLCSVYVAMCLGLHVHYLAWPIAGGFLSCAAL